MTRQRVAGGLVWADRRRPRVHKAAARTLLAVIVLLAAGFQAKATDDPAAPGPAASDLDTRIQTLEREVAALRAEIESLKAQEVVPTTSELARRIEALSQEIERLRIGAAAVPAADTPVEGLGPAASKVYRARRGVSIGGYGEIAYTHPAGTLDDGTRSTEAATADLLRAVLYFGYKFDDRFLFNSELEFEHAVTAGDAPGEVEVEFAYVDFRARHEFGVRGGLLLVPVGFLNELHEPPIFFGVFRPAVETLVIPTTWRELGLGAYGEAGPVAWKAYVVTSLDAAGFSSDLGLREGRQEGAQAVAEDIALTARVDWTPVPGLLVGVSGFSGNTAQENQGVDGGRVTQWDAHAEWNAHGVHLRGLLARTRVQEAAAISVLTGQTIGSRIDGYYGEAAWNVLSRSRRTAQDLSPFVRYEAFDTQAEVAPGFAADPANDRQILTWGLRYRPIPNVALKLDYQDGRNAAGTGQNRLNFGLGWLF